MGCMGIAVLCPDTSALLHDYLDGSYFGHALPRTQFYRSGRIAYNRHNQPSLLIRESDRHAHVVG